MGFKIDDAKEAEAFSKLVVSATFTLTGTEIIKAYRSFAWFNKICEMIEGDLKNGKELKPEPDGCSGGAGISSRSGDGDKRSKRNKSRRKSLAE
jgi:hypothetical protein